MFIAEQAYGVAMEAQWNPRFLFYWVEHSIEHFPPKHFPKTWTYHRLWAKIVNRAYLAC